MPLREERSSFIPEPPLEFIRAVAASAYDVVEGGRAPMKLGQVVTVGAMRTLIGQHQIAAERRQVYQDRRATASRIGTPRLCRVNPAVTEAVVVIHTATRSRSVALRLEWMHTQWRASELAVL